MHWLAREPGNLDDERALFLLEQEPGDLCILSAAPSDLQFLAHHVAPTIHAAGLTLRLGDARPLRLSVAADDWVRKVARKSRFIILRLLGGSDYFYELVEALKRLPAKRRPILIAMPGTEAWDNGLKSMNEKHQTIAEAMMAWFAAGGSINGQYLAQACLALLSGQAVPLPPAEALPLAWEVESHIDNMSSPLLWLLSYRAMVQASDSQAADEIVKTLKIENYRIRHLAAYSLRDKECQGFIKACRAEEEPDLVLSLHGLAAQEADPLNGLPVLQLVQAGSDRVAWNAGQGLSPADIASKVALPELDGRILSGVVSFRSLAEKDRDLQCQLQHQAPEMEQIRDVLHQTKARLNLKKLPKDKRCIAIVLANYPTSDARMANGVGLDTPASCWHLLNTLKAQGYQTGPLPHNSATLMSHLQDGVTNDPESIGRPCRQQVDRKAIESLFKNAPKALATLVEKWGEPAQAYAVAGVRYGHIFVGIQPARGWGQDAAAIYHDPELIPPWTYVAFYAWLRITFGADAFIHCGKHGNLEWLPGRPVALGAEDWPKLLLGPIPHVYPFIVNNPGEGTQAKRRTQAVIIDHLTPPLTRAGLYADLAELEGLLDEYSRAADLMPARCNEIQSSINELLKKAEWKKELPSTELDALGDHLCLLKEHQIRSGLHVLGQFPEGEQAIDLILSLLRFGAPGRPGLLATLLGQAEDPKLSELSSTQRDELDQQARSWVREALSGQIKADHLGVLLQKELMPRFQATENEIHHILTFLDGDAIPAGPAGSPTRGRLDVLPTGRNFYSLDPRVVPTATSFGIGQDLAEGLLTRHFQDHGRHLKDLAMVIWGTSNMRTGGDDIGQAMWLWGCQPVWEPSSERVTDYEIVPLRDLGRPRVDVLCRVSGFFRDAFPELVSMLAAIPKRLANLDEPKEMNPIAARVKEDKASFISAGLQEDTAKRRAELRVFSSPPGCYGTGLLPLIDCGNWEERRDLAKVFLRWGDAAYDSQGNSNRDENLLMHRLGQVEAVTQNQDNWEHDICDADDYFQFHGGLSAAIEHCSGKTPTLYLGDSSRPDNVVTRSLQETVDLVLRARVLNPKWREAMRQHGYKGAAEMAASIDYCFGWSATTAHIRPEQWQGIAKDLVLNEEQQKFLQENNPAALRDISNRLLEAAERGLWEFPDPELLKELQHSLINATGALE